MSSPLTAFLPELVLLVGALALFGVSLAANAVRSARQLSLALAIALIAAVVFSFHAQATLFSGAYRVDAFSQWLKLALAIGYLLFLLVNREAGDLRPDIKPEAFLFLSLAIAGLVFLVSSIDVLTLVVSLELSSFPLYLLVAMRREREGQRMQMESAIKYMMFGIAANGVMLFGLSYLFGLTGTTSLPAMLQKLQPVLGTPLAIAGLGLTFAGLFFKLAVFPFHFWTPDVYQGASNETAGLVASLPKLGAVAVLVRLVSLAGPDHRPIAMLLAILAGASMCYGNLIALVQKDLKRLLGFSGIAHAGYALVGFVALSTEGYAAGLFYITGYLPMVLACFLVLSRVSRDGTNLAIDELAGLHRRSPLLALTVGVAAFALAGIPPFVGFTGKLGLLVAAWNRHHHAIVILAVLNSAIAAYYYLRIVKEAYFTDPGDRPAIALDRSTALTCALLLVAIIGLGIFPDRVLEAIAQSLGPLSLAAR